MGLFGKNKYDPDEGHNNNLFSDDDDDILSIRPGTGRGPAAGHRPAPHALTADEVGAYTPEEINMSKAPSPGSVYDRLKERRQTETALDDDYVPSWAVNKTAKSKPESIPSDEKPAVSFAQKEAKPVDKASTDKELPTAEAEAKSSPEKETVPVDKAPSSANPFLERCRVAAYIVPPESEEVSDEAAVPTVAEIKPTSSPTVGEEISAETVMENMAEKILNNSDRAPLVTATEKPAEKNSDDGGIVFSAVAEDTAQTNTEIVFEREKPDEAPSVPTEEIKTVEAKMPDETENGTAHTNEDPVSAAEEQTALKTDDRKETTLNVEIISEENSGKIMHTLSTKSDELEKTVIMDPSLAEKTVTAAENDVKIYGRIVHGALHATDTDGSDVNMTRVIKNEKANAGFGDETVMFDGVKKPSAPRGTGSSFIISDDDLSSDGEEYSDDNGTYYDRPDPDAAKVTEYDENCNTVKLFEGLEKKRSTASVQAVLSYILTAITVMVSLPFAHIMSQQSAGYFSLFVLIAAAIINSSVFKSLSGLIKGKPGFNACAAVTLIVGVVQTAVCAFAFDGKYSGTAAAVTFMLAMGAEAEKLKTKRIINGLKQIASPGKKTAIVKLDDGVSASVSRDAVTGSAVAVAGIKTENIRNYMRQSAYLSPFDVKSGIFMVIGLIISVIGAVVFGTVTSDVGVGLCSLTLLLCACFPACAALTAELPMYVASSGLAKKDTMLAGFKGAYDINLANVVTVSGADLFPEGSVKLYSMKPLSSYDMSHSIIDAAAVAKAANSPFAGLFAEMLDGNSVDSLPKVDGCQYEDKMGISGWIGERTVLIGNRNLMQGHNIPVPAVSVDQKILRAGYFPVYIACDGVPCLLLMVKYEVDPEVAKALKKLCATGMTVVADPRDPNMTDEMLADYFGLPNDAIKNMHNTGRFTYHKSTAEVKSSTASASYRGSVAGFFAAVTAAVDLKGVISTVRAVTVLAECIGIAVLIKFCLSGKAELICSLPFVIIQLLFTLLTLAVARLKK